MLWPSGDKDCLHHWLMGGGSERSSLVVRRSSVTKSHQTLQAHGLWPSRLLCPWDSPGKKSGVCCHALLQGIFLSRLPMSPAEQEDSLAPWHWGSPSLVVCSSMSSKTHGYMYFRMTGRSTARRIKKFCPESLNEHRATGVGCRILCGPGVVGSGVIRNSESELPLDGPWGRLGSGGWWIRTSPCSGGRKHVGIPASGEPGWTPPGWGWDRTCDRLHCPLAPGTTGHGLGGSIYPTSGSVRDAETRYDWCALSICFPPFTVPQPPNQTSTLPSTFHQMEEGEKGDGAIGFRLQTQLCASAPEPASWNG